MKNIVLTGFMGSGKSTVGRELSKRLGMRIVDTDELIEERMCMSINDIFSRHGEAGFRDIERRVVAEVSKLDGRVIITGGGVVLNKENMANLRRKGVIVYLHVSPEAAYARLKAQTHRPLLRVEDSLKKIRELLEYRAPYYSDNDISVDTSDKSIVEVVEEILKRLDARHWKKGE